MGPTQQPEPDIVPKPKISPKPNVVGVNQVKSTQGEIRPEPAPRSSLIEDAKIDVETPRKKKSAKKHKNKDKNINVPLMTPSELPSEPILPSERPLSPDSALASSESSGSSLRKQGEPVDLDLNSADGKTGTFDEKETTVQLRPKAPSKP